jgi:hypothetical protein
VSVDVLEHGRRLPNAAGDRPPRVDTISGILKMISLHIGLVAESGDLVAEWQKQIDAGNAPVARMKLARA